MSDVLRSRFIGQGPKVEEFEKKFKSLFNIRHAVSLSSGTAALETAYDLIGLGPGDEVISTPLTCTATNLPLIRRGCKIIWADIDEKTLCISPKDVELKTTPNTKAIVQVHLGGIKSMVNYSEVPIVSDAAQALGIFSGDFTVCSFQAIKHISTGDGGMLTMNSDDLEHKAKLLRWFGIDREKKIANNWQAYQKRAMTFNIEVPGTKRHMNDIAAAMGIVGLSYYDRIIDHRSKIFDIYRQELRHIPGLRLVDSPFNTYWLATVIIERRDDFARMLFEADIDSNVVQVRNDVYDIFGGVKERPNPKNPSLPIMDKLEFKYISIPLTMKTTEDDAYYICKKIKGGW